MELKPCPFCGSEALVHKMDRLTTKDRYFFKLECKKCGACQERQTKEKAIEAWNKRVENS